MKAKQIHLRIPEKLYKEAMKIARGEGYRNVQEFMLESLRNSVHDYYKKDVLGTLTKEIKKHSKRIERAI